MMYNQFMTAVQLVLDAPLLKKIDTQAKRLSLSRSEFVRKAMRHMLARLAYLEDIEAERRAYAQKKRTPDEGAMQATFEKVAPAALLSDGDTW
jgi:metal-responsive CopG/Arc/MetJ family transcriptional regulator